MDAAEPLPVKLWPAWIILILQAVVVATSITSITSGINNPMRFGFMMLGPAVGTLVFEVWLLLASRMMWRQRLFPTALMVALPFAVSRVVHESLKLGLFLAEFPEHRDRLTNVLVGNVFKPDVELMFDGLVAVQSA